MAAEKLAEMPTLLQGRDICQVDDAPMTSGSSLSSGVGIVTTDGAWGGSGKNTYDRQDIKILGFTDRNYLPIAKLWYSRLTFLVSFLHESVQPSSRLVLAAYSKNCCKQTDAYSWGCILPPQHLPYPCPRPASLAELAPHGLDVVVILREQAAKVPEHLDPLQHVPMHCELLAQGKC